jgi:hypothetical protein
MLALENGFAPGFSLFQYREKLGLQMFSKASIALFSYPNQKALRIAGL